MIRKGQVFGQWLALRDQSGKYVRCYCLACRTTKAEVRASDLNRGRSTMCKACATKAQQQEHGMTNSSEYSSWSHMIRRCHNPDSKDFTRYGGRGIKVWDPWRESFEAFFAYLGPKPTEEYTIERIDSNGNYEPGNVKWATREEQNRNRSCNIHVTIDNVTKTIAEWAKDSPVPAQTIYKRVSLGWLDRHGPERTIFYVRPKKAKAPSD